MKQCYNCGAKLPEGKGGTDPYGRIVCCAHCFFNPMGCRCKYGEYGVEETYRDDFYPLRFYEADDDEMTDGIDW